jgi:uncharacterized MnhB-related membrane protein
MVMIMIMIVIVMMMIVMVMSMRRTRLQWAAIMRVVVSMLSHALYRIEDVPDITRRRLRYTC